MDFRSILKSLGQLSEATDRSEPGKVKHSADPGGYGRKDDEDEDGKPVKQASTEKKGRGRPKKATQSSGEDKTYDTKSIGDVFGGGKKPKKEIGKVSKKHSLKDWIEHLDEIALNENQMPVRQPVIPTRQPAPIQKKPMTPFKANEAEQIQIKPASQMPKLPGQTPAVSGQPQQVAGQAQKQAQVIQQGNKVIGSVTNPQLVQHLKQAIGKGEMSFADLAMQESVLAEKAKSKKQQKFMGMVHAAQKGEKPASKEVAKVAKDMPKKAAKDFAATKHKGLPEKVKETKDLPGKQEKLDVAPPKGKLTAADFKALGKKKKKVAESSQINEGAIKHLVDDLIADIDGAGFRSAFNIKGHNMERAERQILAAVQHDEKYKGLSDSDQRSLVRLALDFFQDEGELEEGIRTPNIPMGSTTTLPFGARPSVIQQPAAMRKAAGTNFPATLGQVSDRSNDLTSPRTTTGLMRDLSKKSPFSEGKDMRDMQVESWSKQLNAILTEGITVSSSTGQQGAPDSVSVTASDADAQELMQVLRQAGIGGFGPGETPTQGFGSPMSVQVGAQPAGAGTDPEMSPTVVGDGDDMMSLIRKMTGIQDSGEPSAPPAATSDYEDEESEEGEEDYSDEEESEEGEEESEEQTDEGVIGAGVGAGLGAMMGGPMGAAAGGAMGGSLEEEDMEEGNAFSGAVAKAKSDNIPNKGQKFKVGGKEYPVKEEHDHEDAMCEGCGMTESSCGCDDESSEKVEENFANSASDPADTELMKLKALLSVGNDMHRIKTDQTVGNPTRVSVKESLYEWKKLSGIK